MNMKNLAMRLGFAAWAIPLGWLVINAPGFSAPPAIAHRFLLDRGAVFYPGQALAILLLFLGASEYLRMLSLWFPKNGFWLVYIWLALQAASYFTQIISLSTRYDTFILFLIVAIEAFVWGKKSGRWRRASLLFSGTAFLSIAGFGMVSLYGDLFQSVFPSRFTHVGCPPLYARILLSQMGIVAMCAAVFLCDTAAYFIGSLFGKHHFSSVSPHKTIEGSVAGLAAAVMTAAFGWLLLTTPEARAKYSPWFGVALGVIIGVFAQIGDLVVSLMKRYFRVKDASNLIPGHGGVLDRFGSVFFAAPVIHLFVIIVRKFIP